MIEYLIVCPLVFLAGFVDAIAGGGGLISLPAYFIAGLPAHAALGTNKFSASLGTFVATWHYYRCGFIKWKIVLPGVIFALIGSWLGAQLVLSLNAEVFKIILLAILPITAFYIFRKKTFREELKSYSDIKTISIIVIIALLIGLYDGFYGPGTGTFLIILLTSVAHLSLNNAAGATKSINLASNIAALTVFLIHGSVLFPLAIVASVFGILGNYLGAHSFTSNGVKFVKPVIVVVLTILFIKICWEFFS